MPFEHWDGDKVQIRQDTIDADVDAHVEKQDVTMRVAIPRNRKCPNQQMQQQICNLVQIGGDQSANVLANVMIIDVAQLLHFKVVLSVTYHGSSMLERHATTDVINYQKETCAVRDVNRVHFIVLIELEELHRIALQSNLLFYFLADPLQVHVVVLLILVIDLINTSQDLIVVAIE